MVYLPTEKLKSKKVGSVDWTSIHPKKVDDLFCQSPFYHCTNCVSLHIKDVLLEAGLLQLYVAVAGENGELRYQIVAGDSEGQLSIDEESGVITVAKSLDRETRSHYDVTIQAVDQAVDPACRLSSTVVVSNRIFSCRVCSVDIFPDHFVGPRRAFGPILWYCWLCYKKCVCSVKRFQRIPKSFVLE